MSVPHFFQRNIQRIRDLVRMEEEDRRALLRTLTDDEYRDVMNVCATMPNVEMTIKSEGTLVLLVLGIAFCIYAPVMINV